VERICGKRCQEISTDELNELNVHIADQSNVLIDLGTGDGRFVLHTARAHPAHYVIGIDACRDNLYEASRRAPANVLFLIANVCRMPAGLAGLASAITVNFPWGTLLAGLLDQHGTLLATLARLARPQATLEIRLNGGALEEAGHTLEAGGERVRQLARLAGFRVTALQPLAMDDLRAYPTTWAKRLAFGRDPRALYLAGRYHPPQLAGEDCEERTNAPWHAHSR
jgi:trans-aconitate methyltransferase